MIVFLETIDVGETAGRGASDANEKSEHRNAGPNGCLVRGKRASHTRGRHSPRNHSGKCRSKQTLFSNIYHSIYANIYLPQASSSTLLDGGFC